MFHTCFQDAKAQELPRLNRSSMHNLATGTFIFCRALESILSSSSSDPGVCQVYICDCNLNCYSIEAVQRFYHLYKKLRVCTHPQKYSLASMACQSVDSYRSHHMKPRTRAVLGACQPRLAVLPATSGSWVLPLRSCRQPVALALALASCLSSRRGAPTSHPLGSTSYRMTGALAGTPPIAQ